MRDAKTILHLIADIHISTNPNFFYNEVIYFPARNSEEVVSSFLNLSDIFVNQIDMKLLEEQTDDFVEKSSACFFFKN
jgi:hypothetical protein